ncbi:MAG TPA: DUF5117 domain-containing protein, partial [Verrucomicrobiales bacterium]|nr:DUF5117 domain-containing protein [Verrucomicrobiales bacterium]
MLLSPDIGRAQSPRPVGKPPTSSGSRPKSPPKPDFPPFSKIAEGYEKVVSSMDKKPSLYTIWVRKKDNQMLAELPPGFEKQKHFIALTVASGDLYAGLQVAEKYVYWRRYDKRLALIEPNVQTRSTGDPESKSSVKRLFTDRVLLDIPILTLGSSRTPVIDMDALLVGQASKFFGMSLNPKLITIKTAKAFPKNVELAFEAPSIGRSFSSFGGRSGSGQLKTLHYSISLIPDKTGYKPRAADQRVGYFTTGYSDLGIYDSEKNRIRFINRWQLEKADPSLKLSPPKNPLVFYIEHTTPRRYRYWVKQGILQWNEAFEKIGIRDAIEVLQQDNSDPKNPKYMDKDPEDVRYNFVRWLNNNIGTAIGPSRVHPLTGQILDADIILTDGWIRHYERQFSEILPKIAMEGFSPETLAWLNRNPRWDPRIRLAPPAEQSRLMAERFQLMKQPYGGHPIANVDNRVMGDDEFDGLIGVNSQMNGLCLAAEGKAFELALLRMNLDLLMSAEKEKAEKDEEKDKEKDEDADKDAKKKDEDQKLDGVPEKFIGPLIAELVAHEVGHTLGLRHNFKASSIYSLEDINSEKIKGKPLAGSVMDYLPINMRVDDEGNFEGDHTMVGIGPYDMWAIEYGYTLARDLKPILARVAEPELVYGSDEDTWGPDPRSRRYDFSRNPLDYAKSQMILAEHHRNRLLDKFVEDGDSWAKARRGFEMTLSLQTRSLSMMANWVGGVFLNRDKKGDENGRPPLELISAKKQRDALTFVIESGFRDETFGLTPKILRHLSTDQWLDGEFFSSNSADWPFHDRIMGIQASVLTMLMNPSTLRLIYDNEARTEEGEDALTLPELLDTISDEIWSELNHQPKTETSNLKPWISSLRRNLQREHLERLVDLTLPSNGFSAVYKPISNLALMKLRKVHKKISKVLEIEKETENEHE